MKAPISVALVSHAMANPNLGVGALSVSSVNLLQRAAILADRRLNIDAVSMGTAHTAGTHRGILLEREFTLRSSARPDRILPDWLRARRAFSRYDLVVDTSEGDSFADLYGFRRLAWQTLIKSAAGMSSAALVLAPQTLGPFDTRLGRCCARLVLSRASLVAVRDQASFDLVAETAPGCSALLIPDMAMTLPADSSWRITRTDNRAQFGLNVSGLLWNATRQDNFFVPKYREFVTNLLVRLSSRDDLTVHFIPHVIAPQSLARDEDYKIAIDLHSQWPRTVLPDPFPSASAAKGYIGSLDYFVGSRMHAVIAAASSCVPYTAISYSRKFSGTLGLVGLGDVIESDELDPTATPLVILESFSQRGRSAESLKRAVDLASEAHDSYVEALAGMMDWNR